jgi:uncharacterized protein
MATNSARSKPRPVSSRLSPKSERRYRGAGIPMAAIRRFARQIAERFDPEKVILFGSYAYGKPHADSDVDIMVVMPARNRTDQALRIRLAFLPPFPLDLLVRRPSDFPTDPEEVDSFTRDITTKGKVLYEKKDTPLDSESRRRSHRSAAARQRR